MGFASDSSNYDSRRSRPIISVEVEKTFERYPEGIDSVVLLTQNADVVFISRAFAESYLREGPDTIDSRERPSVCDDGSEAVEQSKLHFLRNFLAQLHTVSNLRRDRDRVFVVAWGEHGAAASCVREEAAASPDTTATFVTKEAAASLDTDAKMEHSDGTKRQHFLEFLEQQEWYDSPAGEVETIVDTIGASSCQHVVLSTASVDECFGRGRGCGNICDEGSCGITRR